MTAILHEPLLDVPELDDRKDNDSEEYEIELTDLGLLIGHHRELAAVTLEMSGELLPGQLWP